MQTDLIGSYVESDTVSGRIRAVIALTPGLMLWVETEDGELCCIEAYRVRVRSAS